MQGVPSSNKGRSTRYNGTYAASRPSAHDNDLQKVTITLPHITVDTDPHLMHHYVIYNRNNNRDGSVGTITRLRSGLSGVRTPDSDEFLHSPKFPDRFCVPPSLMKWIRGLFPRGLKRSGREVNHSHPSSAEVKNEWSYTYTPPICLHGVDRYNLALFFFTETVSLQHRDV
jgi:hypothetical protein